MNRMTMLALLVAMALLLVSGVVLARIIDCTGGLCTGTRKADNIVGTTGDDEINGRRGFDTLIGDPSGGGEDDITDNFPGNDVDTIFGGNGNDTINVREGAAFSDTPDVVDCGPGDH